jgi:hypothetical protein
MEGRQLVGPGAFVSHDDLEVVSHGQPYVLETPLLGAPVRPRTIIGQWGMEAPDITAMTPPWMEQKPR